MQQEIQQLGELIKNSQKILLINHVRMDGDALGSLGGLYLLLQKLGKEVKAINDDPIPESFHFLGNTDIIDPKLPLLSREGAGGWVPDLIISLDAADIPRLGQSYENNKEMFENTPLVVIDHHQNEGFGTLNIVDSSYSSTCELVFDIVSEIGFAEYINTEIATYLLMGINTDTNIFYNSNTTYNTFKVASELFRLGGNQRQITNELFKKKGFAQSKLWGEALALIKSHHNELVVGTAISQELFKKTETNYQHTSGLINEFLANIDGAKISYLLYELPDGSIKGSLRSFNKAQDVSKIAQSLDGGGHIQAAAFVVEGKNIQEVEQILIDRIGNILIK